MLSGDCNVCINGKLPSYSATCVECGLSRKNYKPITNADRIRAMTDEELAEFMCHNVSNGTVNCAFCGAQEFCRMGHNGWLDWLRQEARDGET